MTVEEKKTELPEAQYRALLEADPESAAKFTPRPARDETVPDGAPERLKAWEKPPAEDFARPKDEESVEEPNPEKEEGKSTEEKQEPAGEVVEDLGDGIQRKKVNGQYLVKVVTYGKEQWIPQRDYHRLCQSEAAITQRYQALAKKEEEVKSKIKALEDERNGISEISKLFETTVTKPSNDPLGLGLDESKPAAGDSREILALKAEVAKLREEMKSVSPIVREATRNTAIGAAVAGAEATLRDFGLEPPTDWRPIANIIANQFIGDPDGYNKAITDPLTLARVARSYSSNVTTPSAESVKKGAEPAPKPPVTGTVHKPKASSSLSEIREMKEERSRLYKVLESPEGRRSGINEKIIMEIHRLTTVINGHDAKARKKG